MQTEVAASGKTIRELMEDLDVRRKLVIYSKDDIEDSDEYIVIKFWLSEALTYKQIENEMVKLNDIKDYYKFIIIDDEYNEKILVAGKFYFNKSKIIHIKYDNISGNDYTFNNLDVLCWDHL